MGCSYLQTLHPVALMLFKATVLCFKNINFQVFVFQQRSFFFVSCVTCKCWLFSFFVPVKRFLQTGFGTSRTSCQVKRAGPWHWPVAFLQCLTTGLGLKLQSCKIIRLLLSTWQPLVAIVGGVTRGTLHQVYKFTTAKKFVNNQSFGAQRTPTCVELNFYNTDMVTEDGDRLLGRNTVISIGKDTFLVCPYVSSVQKWLYVCYALTGQAFNSAVRW